MSSTKKATVYVDVDDEITTLIDKIVNSKERIVALVLPKRAAMLQSIVNMKLLKRSADEAKKKIVLITSDPAVVPLAGIADVHVAKTLQSKPAIPQKPKTEEDETIEADDAEIDKSKSVGELSGSGDEEEQAVVPEPETEPEKSPGSKKAAKKKGKKFKIPNFSKFRLRLILGVILLILLIGGWVSATKLLPEAKIVVKTDTKTVAKDLVLTAETQPEEGGETVEAKIESLEKDDAVTMPATGEKNVGDKAEGIMTLTNCIDDDSDHTVPKGTSFSKDGKTFVTTEVVELKESIYLSGECATGDFESYGGQKDVDVEAVEGGESFNIDEGTYNSSIAGIRAYGSDMDGGTDEIEKVVSQADIDKATTKLKEETSEGTVDELKALLSSQGFVPFESTYQTEEPNLTISEDPGTEASSVTVAGTSEYKMVGVSKQAIEEKIKQATKEDIDDTSQVISDTGINSATLRLQETQPGVYELSISTLVTVGPQLDADLLKTEVLGKKFSITRSTLSEKAGVVDVDIEYSPFWVQSTPSNPDKVSLTVQNIDQDE